MGKANLYKTDVGGRHSKTEMETETSGRRKTTDERNQCIGLSEALDNARRPRSFSAGNDDTNSSLES